MCISSVGGAFLRNIWLWAIFLFFRNQLLFFRPNTVANYLALRFINANRLGWWHWLDNFWLLVDLKGELDAIRLTDKVKASFPGVHNLVIELNEAGDTWYGFGPNSGEQNMFNWLQKNWHR